MNTSVETLIRILDEERTGRNKAEERVASTLLKLLDAQLELENERRDFERRVASIREEQNYDYNTFRERQAAEDDTLRRDFDRLHGATMRIARDFLVQSIFDEEPSFYVTNKIPFIKAVRERSGLGLKDSKDLVDQFLADRDNPFLMEHPENASTTEPIG